MARFSLDVKIRIQRDCCRHKTQNKKTGNLLRQIQDEICTEPNTKNGHSIINIGHDSGNTENVVVNMNLFTALSDQVCLSVVVRLGCPVVVLKILDPLDQLPSIPVFWCSFDSFIDYVPG